MSTRQAGVVWSLAAALLSGAVGAQQPYRVADVNTTTTGSAFSHRFNRWLGLTQSEGAVLAGVAYLALDDGVHGTELWRSDGTPGGTSLLVDVCPGHCSSWPASVTVFDGALVFSADDGVHGAEPWRSDGTAAGTALLRDLVPGLPGSLPAEFVALGGGLLFAAEVPQRGRELWHSDGTSEGTELLVEIAAGEVGSRPSLLAANSSVVFLTAFEPSTGRELWVSDGTAAGTFGIDTLVPGAASAVEQLSRRARFSYGLAGERLVFHTVETGQVWHSDGTVAGTGSLTAPSSSSSIVGALGSDLLFVHESAGELFATDGTPGGTRLLLSVPDGWWLSGWGGSAQANGVAYFRVVTPVDTQLWSTDGTAAGTVPAVTFATGTASGLRSLDETHFLFYRDDGVHGTEPWVSDGTQAGTRLLADVAPGAESSYLFAFELEVGLHADLRLSSGLLLRLLGPALDAELWHLNADAAQRVAGVNEQSSAIHLEPVYEARGRSTFVTAGEELVFQADDGIHGAELWRSDGDVEGAALVADLTPGLEGSWPSGITSLGGTAVFIARQAPDDTRAWSLGPSAPAAQQLGLALDHGVAAAGGLAYFVGPGSPGGESRLWRTDGTPGGTSEVGAAPDCCPSFGVDFGGLLAYVSGQLWLSDGTPTGTAPVPGGPMAAWSGQLAAAEDLLFFAALDSLGQELWVYDGSTPPHRVVDLRPGPADGIPQWISDLEHEPPRQVVAVGRRAVFLADDGVAGEEPWASDGSATGTVRLQDVLAGPMSSYPDQLVATDRLAFFVADDGAHGRELWRTDGTPEGTRLVLDIVPGPASSVPRDLTAADDLLLFTAWDAGHGAEAWVTDGSPEGTFRLTDIAPGPLSSSPARFTATANLLFFAATDNASGFEPWAVDRQALASTPADFFTTTPCRVFDSRDGSAVDSGGRRLPIAGHCGVPASARAVSANVTVLGATSGGHLELTPALGVPSQLSVANFATGQVRAQQTLLRLGYGEVDARAVLTGPGSVHLIVDVTGWFE